MRGSNLSWKPQIYFLGIGGIGMSAIARYFNAKGAIVGGYDKTKTVLTQELISEGINISFEDNIHSIPKNPDLVIFTPAIPKNHLGKRYYEEHSTLMAKRSEVLGWITAASANICVAGTHGKTTISTMTAHILRDSSYGCHAFLGGIATNYGTNYWSSSANNTVVVEADEYDRSFLQLSPSIAVISAMDPDHLDIYGTHSAFSDAFVQFSNLVREEGKLFINSKLPRSLFSTKNTLTYGVDADADIRTNNLKIIEGAYHFDVVYPDGCIKDVILNMGGWHNVENSLAAIAASLELGISHELIKRAVGNFKGVKRRFEFIWKSKDGFVIDDYAHHPEELRALIQGVEDLYPRKDYMMVFQPHLFSRTKDQAAGFAEVLSKVPKLVLLPIYPAREEPMEGVTSEWLASLVNHSKSVKVIEKDKLLEYIQSSQFSKVVLAGAGDIDTCVQPIAHVLKQKYEA